MNGAGSEPLGLDQHEAGAKLDAGKCPVATLCLDYFPDAIQAVAWVSEVGARKYTPMGWKSVANGPERYKNAGARHALKPDGAFDADVDVPHAAQVAWNALARLQLLIEAGVIEVRQSKADFK